MFGELGLDGRVWTVRGLLPALLAVARESFEQVVVPARQMREAALVSGLAICGADDLNDLFDILTGGGLLPPLEAVVDRAPPLDLADVAGQLEAKWALEVAAGGQQMRPQIGMTARVATSSTIGTYGRVSTD